MRHIRSLIVAIVIAPLAWVLLALGQVQSAGAFPDTGRGGALQTGDFVRPVALLAGAGLLLGILGLLRLSPVGALVIGVVLTLSYTMLLVAPSQVVDLLGRDLSVAGRPIDLVQPVRTGTTMLLGVLLLVGTVSMRRWQRLSHPADDATGTMLASQRPAGTGGFDPAPWYRDPEPETAVRYAAFPALHATAPEPYDTGSWAEPAHELPLRGRNATSGAVGGW
jgi:hypothetical protein